ncbi:hypothetical protein IFM89_008249 [Coptis chinensis]|uniref:Uncharacterized protein n=1 Tax=Coptis chinensis TaxID=261450 RepID=A0A835M488_9MAGN|nr:hypothetical protein IFM89_008249 [Coptis chinensis]
MAIGYNLWRMGGMRYGTWSSRRNNWIRVYAWAVSVINLRRWTTGRILKVDFPMAIGSGDGSAFVLARKYDDCFGFLVASWMSTELEPQVIKWSPGCLMFVTGSSELSFWVPDLSKLGSFVGAK